MQNKEYKGFILVKDNEDLPWSIYNGSVWVGSAETPVKARKDIDNNMYFIIKESNSEE